jgi:hypothetical protein
VRPLLVVLIPTVVHAAPATLKTHYIDNSRVHFADHMGAMGAIDWDEDTVLTVQLHTNGSVDASVTGTRRVVDNFVENGISNTNDERTKWTTRWSGTFLQTATALTLTLALDTDRCTLTKSSDGAAPKKLACRSANKRTTLQCTIVPVALEDAGSKVARSTDIWMCNPTDEDDLGESPAWSLGKNACIVIGGGHKTPTTYSRC